MWKLGADAKDEIRDKLQKFHHHSPICLLIVVSKPPLECKLCILTNFPINIYSWMNDHIMCRQITGNVYYWRLTAGLHWKYKSNNNNKQRKSVLHLTEMRYCGSQFHESLCWGWVSVRTVRASTHSQQVWSLALPDTTPRALALPDTPRALALPGTPSRRWGPRHCNTYLPTHNQLSLCQS